MTTTKTNKKTKKDFFNELLEIEAVSTNQEMVDFINRQIELLNKKSGAEKKPTAQQVENEKLKDLIVEKLTEFDKAKTITELQKEIEELNELSNQRISALVKQLVADGLVVRTEEKRKAYFSIVK